jgi:SPOR domain
MAQDKFRPMRSDDPYARDTRPASGGQGNDPLAELARLIGQEDPFAQLGRRGQAVADPHADPSRAPNWLARPGEAARGRADEGEPYEQPAAGHDPYGQYDPRYDDPQYAGADPYQGAYAADGSDNPAYGYENDPYYGDGQEPPGDGYDEAPREKRRGGLMTVAAVVALAIFGTAGVFGYRAWTSPAPSGEPPVIKAEQTPSKIVPAPPSDGQTNKQVYDRVGDKGGERLVPREEQPTDVRSAARPPVSPGAGAGGGGGGVTAFGPSNVLPPLPTGAATGSIPAGEPKRVKTVTIRAEQPTPAPAPAPQPPVRAAQSAPPAPQVMAAAPPLPPTSTTRSIGNAAPAPQVAARPAPDSAEAGGYLVQVSSQRSEADAQASYRILQTKHQGLLGTRRPIIKRVDLGDRGIYFRAHVGPFASGEDAIELCNSLKAAKEQCIVHRN